MIAKFKNIVIIGLIFIMISCSTAIVISQKTLSNVSNFSERVSSNNYRINEVLYVSTSTTKLANQEQQIEDLIANELVDGNYPKILSNTTRDVEYLKQLYIDTGDVSYIIRIINNYYLIASVCKNFEYISLANEYFNVANKLSSSFKITTCGFTNIIQSEYYFQVGNYEMAKNSALLAIKKANNNKDILINGWISLARAEIALNEFPEAKEVLNKISKNLKYVQNKQIASECYYCCGEYSYKNKYYKVAIKYFLEAYNITKNGEDYRFNMSILNNLAQSYAALGKYKLSTEYYAKDVKCTKAYIKSCEVISGNILDNIRDTNPNEIFYELIMKKREYIDRIVAVVFLVVVLLLVIAIYKNRVKKRKVEELNEALYRDELTDAYNRTYLRKKVRFYIGHNKRFILAILDIDDYKQVNDTYGHVFGDTVLIDTVKTMKETLGDKFIIGRYGGEEFLVIADSISIESFKIKMEELRSNIEKMTWENGHHITISGGVYCYKKGDSKEKVVDKADSLLYKAKRTGKNKIEYEE